MMGTAGHRRRGIAAIELVVIVLLVFLLAGLAVPVVRHGVRSNERSDALGDLRRIAADLFHYRRDTGRWPSGPAYAYTDGPPAPCERRCFGGSSEASHLSEFLTFNRPPAPGWKGPYMSVSRPDPWGHRYVVALHALTERGSSHAWVISAGPDGVFDTTPADAEPLGDDLGVVLR
jgi:type II secretory pathway pseudopilin PulG